MPRRSVHREFVTIAVCGIALSLGASALADIPAGYTGKPFDPKVAGGPKCPPTVVAGPYAIPGRLDFVNYDLGGDGTAYHTGDHITKGGTGYRTDTPTATFSLTSDCIPNGAPGPCQNVWYDTSAALDGTPYPSATTADFSIGAVQDGDWFNLTVNVATAGTYSVSSTWATGNGPPGGEGGDGSIGLEIFSNGVKLATWNAVFPNSATEADFHHWKAYPNFATVTLSAGIQVIKLQSLAKHFQLDYVEFSLGTDDGSVASSGAASGSAGSSGASGAAASGSVSTTGSPATSGTTPASGSDATSGVAPGSGSVAASGSPSASGSASTTGSTTATGSTSGETVGSASGSAGTPPTTESTASSSSKGCSMSTTGHPLGGMFAAALALLGVIRSRRRKAR
jgi:MYXO-CTERM domain-containing protein